MSGSYARESAAIQRDLKRLQKWAQQEPCEVQQREVQGLEKNKSRHSTSWGPSSRKAAWHPGGHQVEHEPAVRPCGKEGY